MGNQVFYSYFIPWIIGWVFHSYFSQYWMGINQFPIFHWVSSPSCAALFFPTAAEIIRKLSRTGYAAY